MTPLEGQMLIGVLNYLSSFVYENGCQEKLDK